MILSNLLLR